MNLCCRRMIMGCFLPVTSGLLRVFVINRVAQCRHFILSSFWCTLGQNSIACQTTLCFTQVFLDIHCVIQLSRTLSLPRKKTPKYCIKLEVIRKARITLHDVHRILNHFWISKFCMVMFFMHGLSSQNPCASLCDYNSPPFPQCDCQRK